MSERVERLLRDLEAEARGMIPGFEVLPKSRSWHQRLVGKLLFFNPSYMQSFSTTLYPKVYLSAALEERRDMVLFSTLAHELVHLWDNQRNRILFPIGYVFPQALALLSFGAIGAFWVLDFFGFLVFLAAAAPWPAYWRMKAEMRGYAMNFAISYWVTGRISEEQRAFVAEQFTGLAYYQMWNYPELLKEEFDRIEADIKSGEICAGEAGWPYRIVRMLLHRNGMLK